MATLNCTLNGINNFTSANSAGVWGYSSWQGATTAINNKPCFGKFYYGGVYKNRALVLKITTPTYPTNSHTRKLKITVPLRRTTEGTDNWHCAISTTAPSFSTTTSAQIPSTWITNWNGQITTSSAWSTYTFGTSAFNFQSNTVYYLWLYSDTPTGNSTTGFYSNNYGAGSITVTTTYSTATSDGNYALPTNPSLYGITGYYSGAKIEIDTNTSYPRCFVGTSTTGTFWRKSLTTSSNGRQYFSVDADTTSTSKTYYIVRMSESYYSSLGSPSSISAPSTAYQLSYSCPRYACQIYCHSQEPLVFYNVNSPTPAYSKFDGMTAQGLSKTATGTTVDLYFSWSSQGPNLNGGTFYMIYTGNKTSTYYCGGSTAHTATTSIKFYGKDSVLTGTPTDEDGNNIDSAMTDCETDNSYSLIGWTEDASNYIPEYSALSDAMVDGSTVYGVYEKETEFSSKSGALYHGDNGSTGATWGYNVSGNEYYYGTGQYLDDRTKNYIYNEADLEYAGDVHYKEIEISNFVIIQAGLGSTDIEKVIEKAQDGYTIGITYSAEDILSFWKDENNVQEVIDEKTLCYSLGWNGQAQSFYILDMTEAPTFSKTNWVFKGWSSDTNAKPSSTIDVSFSYSESSGRLLVTLPDNNTRDVYAILEPDNSHIYFGNNSWKNPKFYYGVNDVWKPIVFRYGVNGVWK